MIGKALPFPDMLQRIRFCHSIRMAGRAVLREVGHSRAARRWTHGALETPEASVVANRFTAEVTIAVAPVTPLNAVETKPEISVCAPVAIVERPIITIIPAVVGMA
ncbi:hypothetical protein GCM10023115_24000 [Pontixanthobacter gangjinensis]